MFLCSGPTPRSSAICGFCEADLPRIALACDRCAVPLPVSGVCGQCLANSPVWESAIAAWSYSGTVPWLVRQFKFHRNLVHGQVLACGLAQRLSQATMRPHVIAPVPLHPQRLRHRGINQALEIARPIGGCLRAPVDPAIAKRIVHTAGQSRLDVAQRRHNMLSAFRICADVRGLSVAIVDDVMTTGNTVGELAGALRRGGAKAVHV